MVCDADLLFINVVARWPGSVHDARILRLSQLFADFESNRPLQDRVVLGDSGYPLRPWLLTPIRNPVTAQQRLYNEAHKTTRSTVERAIGVAKQRWHCLRCGLRIQPEKACKVILACFMLHNLARRQRLQRNDSDTDSSDPDSESDPDSDNDHRPPQNERARVAAGKTARDAVVARMRRRERSVLTTPYVYFC